MYYLTGYFVFLIAAWVAAWYLHDLTFVRDLGPGDTVAYWTVAKLTIWIAPILLIVTCVLKRPAVAYLGLTGFARGVRVGSVVGATFVLLSAIVDVFTRTHALPGPSWGMLSALTVAPLFEEVMFRGFALKALEDSGYRFWPANTIAAILFLGLHLPGWHFMGCESRPSSTALASSCSRLCLSSPSARGTSLRPTNPARCSAMAGTGGGPSNSRLSRHSSRRAKSGSVRAALRAGR